jgi:hypothetical protein
MAFRFLAGLPHGADLGVSQQKARSPEDAR